MTLVTSSCSSGRMKIRHSRNTAGAATSRRAAILYTARSEINECRSTLAT